MSCQNIFLDSLNNIESNNTDASWLGDNGFVHNNIDINIEINLNFDRNVSS